VYLSFSSCIVDKCYIQDILTLYKIKLQVFLINLEKIKKCIWIFKAIFEKIRTHSSDKNKHVNVYVNL